MLRHDGSDRHRHNFEASGVAVALMRGLPEERRSRSGGTGVQDAIWHSYEADDQTEIREETLSRRPSSSVPSTPPSTRPFNA